MTTEKSSKSSQGPKRKSSARSAAPAARPDAAAQPAALSRFQAFKPERVHRSVLKNAPYNPRVISEAAKAKLKGKLKERGLLNALTWNRTTGNLLGGHQRLACLDALEGHGNYLLDVDVVELSAKEEVEENVFLNNPEAQGSYDLDLLGQLLKDTPELDLEATGFELADVEVMFDDPELSTLFAPNEPTKAVLDDVQKQQKAAASKERLQRVRGADTPAQIEDQDTERIAYVVFPSREQREAFMAECDYAPEERYADGARVMGLVRAGRSIPKVSPPARPESK